MSFGSRAQAARNAYGPLCVGIDPHAHMLEEWGYGDTIDGLARFAGQCVEAFAGRVAFVKPQSAFFERFGSKGVAVLEQTVRDLRHTGSLVIMDAKRGDIGSTAEAYAAAYLDEDQPLAADALTVNPYLGFGALKPFFTTAEANDAGVFVLALTSNPQGREVQHALCSDGVSVAQSILRQLADLNTNTNGIGPFGAVVGATIGDVEADLDINGPILVPGFGAQGGTVDDLGRLFGKVLDKIIPATSRGVLNVGPDPKAMRAEAARLNDLLGSLQPRV